MQTKKTNQLFIYLGGIYGAVWEKPLELAGEYDRKLLSWASLIEPLNMDEINFGLIKLRKRKNSFPPNAMEFYKSCTVEPEDINIKRDWQISLMIKDDMYEEISRRINYYAADRSRREYEKIYKNYYEMMVDKKVTDINHDRQIKSEIIHRLIGGKQFLLTAN
jgi:hypothetical protein